MSTPNKTNEVSEALRAEYEQLIQEREQLYQERVRLFGLKPTVYVRNLDPTTTDIELKTWFTQCGPIKEVRLQHDKNGDSSGTAFVEFYYIGSCDEACKRFNEQYRDKSSQQPLQVLIEKKFQTALAVYKAQGYRIEGSNVQGQNVPIQSQQSTQSFDSISSGKPQTSAAQRTQQNPLGYVNPYSGVYNQQSNRNNNQSSTSSSIQSHNSQHQQSSTSQSTLSQQQQHIFGANGESNSLFVANLRPDITLDQFKSCMQEYGTIIDAKVIADKGFGFVTFIDIPTAKNALVLNGQTHNIISKRNTTLSVQYKSQVAKR